MEAEVFRGTKGLLS